MLIGFTGGVAGAVATDIPLPTALQAVEAVPPWRHLAVIVACGVAIAAIGYARINQRRGTIAPVHKPVPIAAAGLAGLSAFAAYWFVVAAVNPDPAHAITGCSGAVVAITAAVTPVTGRAVLICVGAISAAGLYLWTGFTPGPPLVIGAVLLAAAAAAVTGAAAMAVRRPIVLECVALSAVCGVVVSVATALTLYPHTWATRQWDRQPLRTEASSVIDPITDPDRATLIAPRAAAVDPLGHVAVLDQLGDGRFVVRQADASGTWTVQNVSDTFTRPDGARLFLNTTPSPQNAEVLQNLTPSEPVDAGALSSGPSSITSMAYRNGQLYAVSADAVWSLTDDGFDMVSAPWQHRSTHRDLAVNASGQAAVVSRYPPGSGSEEYRATFELLDLDSGDVTEVDFATGTTPADGRAAAPAASEIRSDQWPLVGVSVLPDGRFVTLVENMLVAVDSAGQRQSLLRSRLENSADQDPLNGFTVSGNMLALFTGTRLYMPEFDYTDGNVSLSPGNQNENANAQTVDVSTPPMHSRCGPKTGSTQRILSTAFPVDIANGSEDTPSIVVTNNFDCSGGVWRRDLDAWTLLNDTIDYASATNASSREASGLVYGPFDYDGFPAVISPAVHEILRVTSGGYDEVQGLPSTPDRTGGTWLRRVVAAARHDDTTWLLGAASDEKGADARGDASLYRAKPDGSWDRLFSVPGATGMTVVGDALIVSSCRRVMELSIPRIEESLRNGGAVNLDDQARTVAVISSSWAADGAGCSIDPLGDADARGRLGLVHSVASSQVDTDVILLTHSAQTRDGSWRHAVSSLDRVSGRLTEVAGADLEGTGLVPLQTAQRSDGALCVVTLDRNGAGPLLYIHQGRRRTVELPPSVRANGCHWDGAELLVTDSARGGAYVVTSTDRHGF